MNRNKKNIFLWIIILPASLVCGFLAKTGVHIILYSSLVNGRIISGVSPEFIEKIEYYIFPFIFWGTCIFVAHKIAPKHKIKTTFSIIVFYVLLNIILLKLLKIDTTASFDLVKFVSGLIGLLSIFLITGKADIISLINYKNNTVSSTNTKIPSKRELTDSELRIAVENYKRLYIENNVDENMFPAVKSLKVDMVVKLIDSIGEKYPEMHIDQILETMEKVLKRRTKNNNKL